MDFAQYLGKIEMTYNFCILASGNCDAITTCAGALKPVRCGYNCESVVCFLRTYLMKGIISISCDMVIRWMPQELNDNIQKLIQIDFR